jgi:dGTPase
MIEFTKRFYDREIDRPQDVRSEYERDKGLVVHSAAFRRLQGKTQVMGVGEGDFHRTRLTHSIEAGQIGEALLKVLRRRRDNDAEILPWLTDPALIVAACYAHDLGHPPYGHGGERALHTCVRDKGGFEGNAQTLRILTKLEKYYRNKGINPTRRTILAVLKYPINYTEYQSQRYQDKPPKCFYSSEQDIVDWTLEPFTAAERALLKERNNNDLPIHRSLDSTIMECADDIAYAVHDLEDIVARRLVTREELQSEIERLFGGNEFIGLKDKGVRRADFVDRLFQDSYERKEVVGRLVNLFVTEVRIGSSEGFTHPLLKYRLRLPVELSLACTPISRQL